MKVLCGLMLMLSGALIFPPMAVAQERSFLCKFTSGPRAGQTQDYSGHPAGALPVGTPCQDGAGSSGAIVSSRRSSPKSSPDSPGTQGGSCRQPSSEEDCDKCSSDAAYERCLKKVTSN